MRHTLGRRTISHGQSRCCGVMARDTTAASLFGAVIGPLHAVAAVPLCRRDEGDEGDERWLVRGGCALENRVVHTYGVAPMVRAE